MDIRFVNSKNEIINATNLSIKAENRFLIGMNEKNEKIIIEAYNNGEEAEEVLKKLAERLLSMKKSMKEIIVDLRRKEKC